MSRVVDACFYSMFQAFQSKGVGFHSLEEKKKKGQFSQVSFRVKLQTSSAELNLLQLVAADRREPNHHAGFVLRPQFPYTWV